MTKYVVLPFNKKLNLLRAHAVGCGWPDLDQEHWCLHCRRKFNGHSVRVWRTSDGSLWLECGTPGCDGSPVDWAPFPWWDPKDPETRRQLKKKAGQPKRKAPRQPSNLPDDDVPF